MKRKSINTRLLRRIQKQILKEPRRFLMHRWFCDTAACIGGWAIALDKNFKLAKAGVLDAQSRRPTSERAAQALGLRRAIAERLFYVDEWPSPFREQYDDALGRAGRARVAARRIEHFIKTKGKE